MEAGAKQGRSFADSILSPQFDLDGVDVPDMARLLAGNAQGPTTGGNCSQIFIDNFARGEAASQPRYPLFNLSTGASPHFAFPQPFC